MSQMVARSFDGKPDIQVGETLFITIKLCMSDDIILLSASVNDYNLGSIQYCYESSIHYELACNCNKYARVVIGSGF